MSDRSPAKKVADFLAYLRSLFNPRTLVRIATVLYVTHIGLAFVGWHESYLKASLPTCERVDHTTASCVIHVNSDVWLVGVAWQLGMSPLDIVSNNPTLPLFWPVPSGRDIYVTRRDPTSMSNF
jgi:hypothetical protein